MSTMTWQKKAAKREIAKSALQLALIQIDNAIPSGGSTTSGGKNYYIRALHLIREAESALRLSESDR